MLVVEGRILQRPTPTYGNDKLPTMYPGSWSSMEHELVVPMALPKWTYLRLGDAQFEKPQYEAFAKAFREGGLQYEASFRGGIRPVVNDPRDDDKLSDMFSHLEEAGIELLLVVLPQHNKYLYDRLK